MFEYIFLGLIWAFVTYRLIRGSKIKVETEKSKYNLLAIVLLAIALLVLIIRQFSIKNLIVSIGVCLAYIVYTCIPNGYNEEAIYVKGKVFPYETIDEVSKEYIDDIYRLNFRHKFRFYYLEVKEGNEGIIIDCEKLYKKRRNIQ